MAVSKKLLFVDTNIWLDFYRPRQSDVALDLLGRLEKIKDKIIVTHILEMEYKSNRQSAILEGLKQLNQQKMPPTLGIFSEAKASKSIEKHHEAIEIRLRGAQETTAESSHSPAAARPRVSDLPAHIRTRKRTRVWDKKRSPTEARNSRESDA